MDSERLIWWDLLAFSVSPEVFLRSMREWGGLLPRFFLSNVRIIPDPGAKTGLKKEFPTRKKDFCGWLLVAWTLYFFSSTRCGLIFLVFSIHQKISQDLVFGDLKWNYQRKWKPIQKTTRMCGSTGQTIVWAMTRFERSMDGTCSTTAFLPSATRRSNARFSQGQAPT